MTLPIKKQTVLITGSARGLGAEIAKAFHREGATIIINYRKSEEKAKSLSDSLGNRALLLKGDVRIKDAINEMHKELTDRKIFINTIVHNAIDDYIFNGDDRKKINEIEWTDFQNQLETSQKGFLNLLQIFTPEMKEKYFGRIINIGTNLFQNPVVPYHEYIAGKGGLLSLTRTSAIELGQYNITVNMISGGLLKITDASKSTPENVFNYISSNTPLRKVTTTQDFADAVLFFACPWSRSVTGQNLIVDGGLVLN